MLQAGKQERTVPGHHGVDHEADIRPRGPGAALVYNIAGLWSSAQLPYEAHRFTLQRLTRPEKP